MTLDQQRLVLDNEGLVHHMLRRFRDDYYYEDMLSAGRCGMIKAAYKYDQSKGKFPAFAGRIIYQEAIKARAKRDVIHPPEKHSWDAAYAIIPLDAPCNNNPANNIGDLIEDANAPALDEQLQRADKMRLIRKALMALSKPQRRACIAVMRGKKCTSKQRMALTSIRRHNKLYKVQQLKEALHAT
jgi:RNA polymerase sigma factor (sigma-70 family)